MSPFPEMRRLPRARLLVAAAVLAAGALAWASREAAGPELLLVRRGDLVLTVEVDGELEAVRAALLGPPALADTEFKISFLAPESRLVKKGEPVLAFDPQQLETALETKEAELEEASQRLVQRQKDLQMKLLDLDEELARAQADLGKARLKADVPPELSARVELRAAELEAEGKAREVRQIEARREAAKGGGEAEIDSLRAQRERARARVGELRAAIDALTVRAPQDGIVIHASDWRDEKKKVGDAVWMMENVVELPDLSEMKAVGDVDEADAGRVTPGQPVRLRLESREDVDFEGRVRSLGRSVRRRSWRVPGKVFRVEIALDRSDPQVMRPAMRFRGQIEVGRARGVVLVPREAVFLRASGPVAFVARLGGLREQPLRLGRRGAREIEVLQGLEPGQRVSALDPALDARPVSGGPR